jgi:hypothetical protein
MVIPVAVEGTFDIWPIGGKPKLTGKVEAAVGDPIPSQDLVDLGEEAGMALLKSRIVSLRLMCRNNIDRRLKK